MNKSSGIHPEGDYMNCRPILLIALAGLLAGAMPVFAKGPQWIFDAPLHNQGTFRKDLDGKNGTMELTVYYSEKREGGKGGPLHKGAAFQNRPCTFALRDGNIWVQGVSFSVQGGAKNGATDPASLGRSLESRLKEILDELKKVQTKDIEVRMLVKARAGTEVVNDFQHIAKWSTAADAMKFFERWLKEDVLLNARPSTTSAPEPLRYTFLGDTLRKGLETGKSEKR